MPTGGTTWMGGSAGESWDCSAEAGRGEPAAVACGAAAARGGAVVGRSAGAAAAGDGGADGMDVGGAGCDAWPQAAASATAAKAEASPTARRLAAIAVFIPPQFP